MFGSEDFRDSNSKLKIQDYFWSEFILGDEKFTKQKHKKQKKTKKMETQNSKIKTEKKNKTNQKKNESEEETK